LASFFGKLFIKSIYHKQERLLDRPPTAGPGPTQPHVTKAHAALHAHVHTLTQLATQGF